MMGENEKFVQEAPYNEMGIWACLYNLATEIDKLNGPLYGPTIEDLEIDG